MIHRLDQRRQVALLACVMAAVGCSESQPRAEGRLVSDSQGGVALGSGDKPFVIELGNLPMDSSHSKQVRLTNGTSKAIRIDGFQASCECTSVAGLPIEIPAGGTRDLTLSTDLAKEPGFTGGLAIAVELRSGSDVKGIVEVRCNAASPANEKE